MSVKILLPAPLRPHAGDRAFVEVEAATVAEAMHRLSERHPELRRHLFAASGRLRSSVNVHVGDQDVRAREGEDAPVDSGDEIVLVPSVAGGPAVGGGSRSRDLSHEEIARYSRHLIMPEVAMDGQRKLKAASVLMVGAGGLGSPAGLYLAAAGVGRLGIVDFDAVDASNLQRQVLYGTGDVGRPKLDVARERLRAVNPHVEVEPHGVRLTSENALDIVRGYDLVVDGTDNFPTRYLVNDACVLAGKPNVYGSIFRFEGQASVFWAEAGPCYRCLYPEPPPPGLVPSCAEGGVLGVLPGIVGTLQATEAIKLIVGRGEPLLGRLLLFDALGMEFRELKLRKDPECPVCGERPTVRELVDYEQFCGIAPTAGTDPALAVPELDPADLKSRVDRGEPPVLVDVRSPQEWQICRLEGSRLIPLGELASRVHELDSRDEIVFVCKVGQRSAAAADFVRRAGFSRVWNLRGGLAEWSRRVDPSMPRY